MENLQYEKRNLKGSEVIIGRGLINQIVPAFNHRFSEGALLFLYDRAVTALAEEIIRELRGAGYRLFVRAISSKRREQEKEELCVPEYVRHVFAVGAGSAAEYAKGIAKELDIAWTLFLSAPSTDTVMCSYAPKLVFIDENVLLECPFECVAAGYGILLSQSLSAFEGFFARKVLAEDVEDKPCAVGVNIGLAELAYALLELSTSKRQDSAQIMSEILYAKAVARGRRPRLIGEYRYLASAVLAAFYSAYLGAPSIDALPPACREVAADKLNDLNVWRKHSKNVDFFDLNSYFRISYILGEYRTDLLDKLGSGDFHTTQRFWRRLYPDAGYWLKGEITCADLLEALRLAGVESDSLLGYAYASGVMEKF